MVMDVGRKRQFRRPQGKILGGLVLAVARLRPSCVLGPQRLFELCPIHSLLTGLRPYDDGGIVCHATTLQVRGQNHASRHDVARLNTWNESIAR